MATTRIALIATLAFSLLAMPALAAGTPQNHHCEKDGATVAGKTHKQCTKDGGKWVKNAAPAAAAPAPAAAAAPAGK